MPRARPLHAQYVFYTSDHGFQLGEMNMLMDKRHVYDFDTVSAGKDRRPRASQRRLPAPLSAAGYE